MPSSSVALRSLAFAALSLGAVVAMAQAQNVTAFNPYNGVTDEMCKVYLARRLSPVKAQRDETEEFEHVQLSPIEIEECIRSGKIWDGIPTKTCNFAKKLLPPGVWNIAV